MRHVNVPWAKRLKARLQAIERVSSVTCYIDKQLLERPLLFEIRTWIEFKCLRAANDILITCDCEEF